MENRLPTEAELIGRFIRSHRRLTDVGDYPEVEQRNRRSSYLSQSDLAKVAGVSTVVISQLEQGRYPNLNSTLLTNLARVLHLNEMQLRYMRELNIPRPAAQQGFQHVPDWVAASINQVKHSVIVINPAMDVLATNTVAMNLVPGERASGHQQTNAVEFAFHTLRVDTAVSDWDGYARTLVSNLRLLYARFPSYRNYIDELANRLHRYELFTRLWNQDDPLVPSPTMEIVRSAGEVDLKFYRVISDLPGVEGILRIELLPTDAATREHFNQLHTRIA